MQIAKRWLFGLVSSQGAVVALAGVAGLRVRNKLADRHSENHQ
jgi:hypothetical protein